MSCSSRCPVPFQIIHTDQSTIQCSYGCSRHCMDPNRLLSVPSTHRSDTRLLHRHRPAQLHILSSGQVKASFFSPRSTDASILQKCTQMQHCLQPPYFPLYTAASALFSSLPSCLEHQNRCRHRCIQRLCFPHIGIRIRQSAHSDTSSLNPFPSFPIRNAQPSV